MTQPVPEEEITHSEEDDQENIEAMIGEPVVDPFPETWPDGVVP
jgi:hypothetical protein